MDVREFFLVCRSRDRWRRFALLSVPVGVGGWFLAMLAIFSR